ncbi:hypothetical protein [Streptomyces sparsogenes]|uniref:hypothetical protein n=1 Tax=Streptomyces sparsogenes TaxID=67365 RepID=UPI0033DE3757
MRTEFVTPDHQDFLNTLGVEAEITGDTQRTLKFAEVTGEDLTFSYDATGQSVRVAWRNASGKNLVTIFREGATLLRITEEGGVTQLLTEFRTRDTAGQLVVQVFPDVQVEEKSLLS